MTEQPGQEQTIDRRWRDKAVCRGEDPELFFPVGTGEVARLQTVEAKTVCGWCPVVQDCLTWAVETGQDHGVFGGMSEDERRQLRRRRDPRPRTRPRTRDPRHATAVAGREAMDQGMPVKDAAARFGVTEKTAQRWRQEAARARDEAS